MQRAHDRLQLLSVRAADFLAPHVAMQVESIVGRDGCDAPGPEACQQRELIAQRRLRVRQHAHAPHQGLGVLPRIAHLIVARQRIHPVVCGGGAAGVDFMHGARTDRVRNLPTRARTHGIQVSLAREMRVARGHHAAYWLLMMLAVRRRHAEEGGGSEEGSARVESD